jgi:hypothetical protein
MNACSTKLRFWPMHAAARNHKFLRRVIMW